MAVRSSRGNHRTKQQQRSVVLPAGDDRGKTFLRYVLPAATARRVTLAVALVGRISEAADRRECADLERAFGVPRYIMRPDIYPPSQRAA